MQTNKWEKPNGEDWIGLGQGVGKGHGGPVFGWVRARGGDDQRGFSDSKNQQQIGTR